MKKILTIMMMFLTVLTLWGQSGQSSSSSRLDSIRFFRGSTDSILINAQKNRVDTTNVRQKMKSLFDEIDTIATKLTKLRAQISDEQLNSLEVEYENLRGSFVVDFSKAILNKDKTSISVKTNNFIEVIDKYQKEYDKLYNKLPQQESSNNQQNGKTAVARTNNIPILLWILSSIGALVSIIGLCSVLIIRSRINTRINERKREIQDLEKSISSFKEELKKLTEKIDVVPSKKSYVPQTSYLPESLNREEELDNVDNNTKLKPSPKRVIKNTPSGYNLYATVKVGSSFPEFFKVSREKTGDKVFMLTLAKEGDEVAEFTIVPDMTPDFMKSIISDRETYLPPVFCEKIIENQNPTKIEVKSKGRAKKESGRWTVQDRMSIKLV